MTRRSRSRWIPPATPGRRGPGRSYDPFYAFKQLARDDGEPSKSPEPTAERELLSLLGSKAALAVMTCLLALVVATLLVLLVVRP